MLEYAVEYYGGPLDGVAQTLTDLFESVKVPYGDGKFAIYGYNGYRYNDNEGINVHKYEFQG